MVCNEVKAKQAKPRQGKTKAKQANTRILAKCVHTKEDVNKNQFEIHIMINDHEFMTKHISFGLRVSECVDER